MALVGIELETLVSEPDALTTQPPFNFVFFTVAKLRQNFSNLHSSY